MKAILAAACLLAICGCSPGPSGDINSSHPLSGPATQVIRGQASWVVTSDAVELAVTHAGAHMAPVTFYRASERPVQPYYISPWQGEGYRNPAAPVMVPLRGDFFCMPFGGNGKQYEGEKHPPHGEVAGSPWTLKDIRRTPGLTILELELKTKVRPGTVTRTFTLLNGQNVVYTQEKAQGYKGKMAVAHHATLALPEKEGSVRIATSPYRFGMTAPFLFSDPAAQEYQSFEIGKRFTDLAKVPLNWKEPSEADCTRFPARTGFADLLMICSDQEKLNHQPAWTTATNTEAGYVWFSLKDAKLLPSTVFWIENKGRHEVPWDGRNRCLGLEDVCAFFDRGLAESAAPNVISKEGVPTCIELSPEKPLVVNYIQGVAKIPANFDVARTIEFGHDSITLVAQSGAKVTVPVKHSFIQSGRL